MDCVTVVENLSQREKNSILHVLQRDEQLRHGQEQKISNLKREINQIRMCSVLRAGDDQTKICLRCRSEMGLIFNRGALCPACKYKVCKNCQEVMFNGSWLCKLCYRQRQLKWLTGEWTASFDQNPLRKWASGSDIMNSSLQLMPGTTSIDIDESPSNHGNSRQGRKVARNGVGGGEQGRSRVEVPKEGDQLKLSELFSVLRVKKPEENVAQETQVRRITSRKYSESDSDSSSNSDIDVRSTSTAPSVTESELEARRIESPRHLESPVPRLIESQQASGFQETRVRKKPVITIEAPESILALDNEKPRPKAAPRSPKPAARRKVKSEHLEHDNVTPTARPRTKDRQSPRSEMMVEGQMQMSRSVEVHSSRHTDDSDQLDRASVNSDLNLHVAKTRESLDKKFEVEKSRSQASLDKRSLESETLVRPKSKEHLARRSADNLSLESKQALRTEQPSIHMSGNMSDDKTGADSESSKSFTKPDILIKTSDIRENKFAGKSQTSNQNFVEPYSDRSIQSKHSIEQEHLVPALNEDGPTQREGSPYSFSMDSLPSSHPSPTFNRCSLSSNPDSDSDSITRASSRPEPILEQNSEVDKTSSKSSPKTEEPGDVVVEEISKVQFRRVSRTVGQIGSLAKMSLSPNKRGSRSNQDDFETLAVDAKGYLSGNVGNRAEIVKPKLRCIEYIQHETSPESSDSDILSVIEEVEDETSESSDDETKDHKPKGHNEIESGTKLPELLVQNGKLGTIQSAEIEKNIWGNKLEVNDEKISKTDVVQKEKENTKMKGTIFQKVKDMEQKVKNSSKGSGAAGAGKNSDSKCQEKYKKIHEHWLAVEKHEADILDVDDFDKGDEYTPNNTEYIAKEEIKNVETEPIEIPINTIHSRKNIDELDANLKDAELVKGHGNTDKRNSENAYSQVEMTDDKDDHNAKTHDSVIKECEISMDNGTFHGITTAEKQPPRILSSTMIDSKSYKASSINDSDTMCHSISDISGFTNLDNSECSAIWEHVPAADMRQKTSTKATMDYCDSWPNIESQLEETTVKEKASKVSLTESEPRCQSISELSDPLVESLTSDVSSLSFSALPTKSLEDSQNAKDEVFNSSLLVDVPDVKQGAGKHVKRLTSDELRIELIQMQQPQKIYKTEVALQVDKSGKVTPPATAASEPQFFKAPEKPPRFKRQTSSSSGPSSPEISAVIPKVYMESPKSERLSSARDSPRTMSECSVSQDDSGNVSGGSRGTTPEHRRTDSSYSQSSIPSTLSNVTDEDEDIDRIVAKVQRQSKSGTNLLSVFGDSRESLASYYSDAGDIAYSNVPITGEVLFSLNYNYKTSMLEVGVKQCRNIAVADTKRRRSDPYVKTYLLPDRTRGGKRKTKVKKHTTSPTFDETLKYSLTKSELENRTLWLTVWHNDRFGRNVFLGEVTINFDYYKFDDPFPRWYPLQERMDAPPASMMVYKGDLSICIRFVPAEKLGASPSTTGKHKDGGKGQLQVMVKEARNLTGVKSNGFSDPFCKAYLLPERHKSSKQKTAVVKKDCSPVWNHTFIFEDVTLMELRERCLELTIWDYEKLTSNDFLGGIRLNLGTGVSCGKTVDWMDARGEEMSMWQAMLDRPNIWIDGALILRPNMEKRKF